MQQANNIPKFSFPAPQPCSKPKTVKNLHKKSFSKFKHAYICFSKLTSNELTPLIQSEAKINFGYVQVVKWYNAFFSGARGLWFKSRAGQIVQSVANGSPPLRHFFKMKRVARARNFFFYHGFAD